ncbi:MAG TPA: FHA domain-containing protein [Anaeromyxobacteraceae bacterium]|nr:FHA domain-containing protein [Anaeromyxobacteraceae bacterium]
MVPEPAESTRALAGALVAGAAPRASPRMVAIAGPGAGAAFALEHGAVLGRSRSARLRLLDPAASGLHLRFGLGTAGVVVEDVGSRNGATLNGRPLPPGPSALSEGDEIGVGATILRVEGVGGGVSPRADGGCRSPPPAALVSVPLALTAAALLALAAALALGAG